VSDFLTALGVVLVLEGLLYGGFPAAAQRFAAEIAEAPEGLLRIVGMVAMVIGVVVVWFVRG